jgi:hypothetical protein
MRNFNVALLIVACAIGPGLATAQQQPVSMTIDGIEVTQGIQNLANSVPLVSNKPTLVRVYLSALGTTRVKVAGAIAFAIGNSKPQSVTGDTTALIDPSANNDLGERRKDMGQSLNFLLPPQMVPKAGDLVISVSSLTDSDPNGPTLLCVNCATLSVTKSLQDVPPLRVRIIGLRYRLADQSVVSPSASDYELIESWLKRAYPVSSVLLSHDILDSNKAWPIDCNDAIDQVGAVRAQEMSAQRFDPLTHYYALVADNGGKNFMRGCSNQPVDDPDPGSVGSGPTGRPADSPNFNWDKDDSYGDWYTGHELGHTFGRQHPGYCGQPREDNNVPDEFLAHSTDATDFAGWDGGLTGHLDVSVRFLPGRTYTDIMTYCQFEWLSAYTYAGILQRLLLENTIFGPNPQVPKNVSGSPNASKKSRINGTFAMAFVQETQNSPGGGTPKSEFQVVEGNFLNIRGSINLIEKTGKLSYILPVTRAIVRGAPGNTSAHSTIFRIVTTSQKTTDYPCEMRLNSVQEPLTSGQISSSPVAPQTASLDCNVPFDPAAMSVLLVFDGKVVDSRTVTKKPPSVSKVDLPPSPGAPTALGVQETPEPLVFRWKATSPDAKNITYNVELSKDQGKTWELLALGLANPSYAVSPEKYTGLSQIMLRVTANDGYRSTIVTSKTLKLK